MNLILAPNPLLRTKCAPVVFGHVDLRPLEREMIATLLRERGLGLAAPQVGVLSRVFAIKPTGFDPLVLFNPEVISIAGGYITDREGCLSFPNEIRYVRRAAQVAVRYWDVDGREHGAVFLGYDARCVQHELDHLDGVTFDTLPVPQSFMARKALQMARGRR